MNLEQVLWKIEKGVDRVLDWFPIISTMRLKSERKYSIDALVTELPGAGYFSEKLATAIEDYKMKGIYFEVVVTDMAGLKYANQVLKKEGVGDDLLRVTAGILRKSQLTRRDTLGRWGGDEFGYIFTGDKGAVKEGVRVAQDNVYGSQEALNERFAKKNNEIEQENRLRREKGKEQIPLMLGGMELCIGLGVVTPDDIPEKYLTPDRTTRIAQVFDQMRYFMLGRSIPKAEMQNLMKYLLRDVGDARAEQDKTRQGIYIRHPEYDRKPKGTAA